MIDEELIAIVRHDIYTFYFFDKKKNLRIFFTCNKISSSLSLMSAHLSLTLVKMKHERQCWKQDGCL